MESMWQMWLRFSVVGPLLFLTLVVNNVELVYFLICGKIEYIRINIFARKV
jgi:hypothetical protein